MPQLVQLLKTRKQTLTLEVQECIPPLHMNCHHSGGTKVKQHNYIKEFKPTNPSN